MWNYIFFTFYVEIGLLDLSLYVNGTRYFIQHLNRNWRNMTILKHPKGYVDRTIGPPTLLTWYMIGWNYFIVLCTVWIPFRWLLSPCTNIPYPLCDANISHGMAALIRRRWTVLDSNHQREGHYSWCLPEPLMDTRGIHLKLFLNSPFEKFEGFLICPCMPFQFEKNNKKPKAVSQSE